MRDDAERLRDILDAIHQVERYLQKGRDEFDTNELVQVWVVHHLQIIGEAARGVSRELRAAHPEVPWADVIAFRNLLTVGWVPAAGRKSPPTTSVCRRTQRNNWTSSPDPPATAARAEPMVS